MSKAHLALSAERKWDRKRTEREREREIERGGRIAERVERRGLKVDRGREGMGGEERGNSSMCSGFCIQDILEGHE